MINFSEIKNITKRPDGTFDIASKKSSNNYRFFGVDWRRIQRFDQKGNVVDPEIFKQQTIEKNGIEYFNQNFACQFLGSSSTLINSKILAQMNSVDPEYIRDNKLKVFEEPKKGHSYIMSVDPAKDGIDAFAIHVMDVTTINFTEVACAQLQIDYLKMPAWLDSWGKWYNYAFLIIENNEGAGQSIADIMFREYEYENLYFDKERLQNSGALRKKKFPGFRTTSKTRKLILDNLRTFIEQGKLEVRSKETIEEFYHFILIDEKYQADDGYHDDMIMSLAITFAPFCETKNFDDLKGMINALYSKEQAFNENNFDQFMTIGFMDDNGDDEYDEYQMNEDPWNDYDSMDDEY